jgi:hypothetical protein
MQVIPPGIFAGKKSTVMLIVVLKEAVKKIMRARKQ